MYNQTTDRCNSVMDSRDYEKKQFHRVTIRANVPVMRPMDSASRTGTTFTGRGRSNSNESLPLIAYKHGEDGPRNLPGHSELVRILAEIARSNPEKQTIDDLTLQQTSNWLSLYATDRPKQRVTTRKVRRSKVPVCSFCQEKGGNHKKWCVNLVETPAIDPYSSMKRSKTDISEFFKRPKKVKPVVVERPFEPSKRFALRPADFPDYTELHREVYEQALAVSRAKLAIRLSKKGRFALERQLTDPFIFSYMNRYGTGTSSKFDDGMVHMFGKRGTDFTKLYEYSAKRIKAKT